MKHEYFSSLRFQNTGISEKMELHVFFPAIATAATINEFIAVITAKKGFELSGEIKNMNN